MAFPTEPSASSQAPPRCLLPAHQQVGFRGSPALPARRCGCSCIHYLLPTAPNRGPCEKQTPRGLAEEAGERFPRPCHGCCRGPCSPGGSGTSRRRPAGNGCRAWFSRPPPPPLPAAARPAPWPRTPAWRRENVQTAEKALGEVSVHLACGARTSTMGRSKRKLKDCQCPALQGSDLHAVWLSPRVSPEARGV